MARLFSSRVFLRGVAVVCKLRAREFGTTASVPPSPFLASMASKSKKTTAFAQADKGDSGSRVSKRSDDTAGSVTAAGGDAGRHQRASAAGARRAVAVQEEVAAGINEQADDFIRRFREQLRLQRLESIENYRRMVARGL